MKLVAVLFLALLIANARGAYIDSLGESTGKFNRTRSRFKSRWWSGLSSQNAFGSSSASSSSTPDGRISSSANSVSSEDGDEVAYSPTSSSADSDSIYSSVADKADAQARARAEAYSRLVASYVAKQVELLLKALLGSLVSVASAIEAGNSDGGGVRGTIYSIQSTSITPECVAQMHLNVSAVEALAASMFEKQSFKLPTSGCGSQTLVQYPSIGPACREDTNILQAIMYEKGVILMLLGASSSQAFAPLEHFRVLATNLAACQPKLNPPGQTSLPHSFVALYELYEVRLLGRLHESAKLRSTPSNSSIASAMDAVDSKVRLLQILPIDADLNKHLFLPQESELSNFVSRTTMASPREIPVINTAAYKARKPLNVLGLSRYMTEAKCDRDADPSHFFLKYLSFETYSEYENCCAQACSALKLSARFDTGSTETCCQGCNRYKCKKSTKEQIIALGNEATVVSAAKIGKVPVAYTFAM